MKYFRRVSGEYEPPQACIRRSTRDCCWSGGIGLRVAMKLHGTPERREASNNAVSFICVTCGTQFADSEGPPAHCPICDDERQYVGLQGQQWTTLDELRRDHRNEFR